MKTVVAAMMAGIAVAQAQGTAPVWQFAERANLLRQPLVEAGISYAPADLHLYVKVQCSLFEGAAMSIGLGARGISGVAKADAASIALTLTVAPEGTISPAPSIQLQAMRDDEAPLTLGFKASGTQIADAVRFLAAAPGAITVSNGTVSRQFPIAGAAPALNRLVERCPLLAEAGR